MSARQIGIAAAAWSVVEACAAQGCGDALPGAKRVVEGNRYTIAFATVPDPVPTDRHFAVDFAVCPRGAAPMPTSARIDANMPEHRHGMNYRPSVTSPRPGIYHAEGLLFHMPGRWDLTFDLVTGDATERLTGTLRIE